MLKGKGKVWKASSSTVSHVIHIPADVVKDSAYPFNPKEEVSIELDPKNKRLIITKRNRQKNERD